MTWARTVATGLGSVAYRLVIVGLPYEFVTDFTMKRTATATIRGRAVGLMRKGLVADQRVDLRKGLPTDSGMTVTIQDPDGFAAECFAHLPDKRTYLTATATAAATSLTVASIAGWVTGDHLYVGGEKMRVTATPSGTTIFTALVSGRGLFDTYKQVHYATDGKYLSDAPVTNRALSVEGRRCTLFAYGEGDSLAGNGTAVFVGICATDAKRGSDGSAFTIQIDPRSRLLAQTIGSKFTETVEPRGIYYSDGAPLSIIASYSAGDSLTDVRTPGGKTFLSPLVFTGFYKDQETFCAELSTALASKIAAELTVGSLVPKITAIAEEVGWSLNVSPPVSNSIVRYVNISLFSPVDSESGHMPTSLIDPDDGGIVGTVVADVDYKVRFGSRAGPEEHRDFPRGFIGSHAHRSDGGAWALTGATTGNPRDRLYYGGSIVASAEPEAVQVVWPELGDFPERETGNSGATFAVASGRIDGLTIPALGGDGRPYYPGSLPTIRFSSLVTEGNVADFFRELTVLAPAGRNGGDSPDLIQDDFADTSWALDWDAIVDPAADRSRVMKRRTFIPGEPMRLDKFVSGEMLALGLYIASDAEGRMVPRAYKLPVATDPDVIAISESQIDVSRGSPSWEKQAVGSTHTVTVSSGRTQYNNQVQFKTTVIDAEARAKNPAAQILDVQLYSLFESALDPDTISADDMKSIFSPVLGMLGHEYAVIELDTFISSHAIQIGDVVTVTSKHIPDWQTGLRGVTDLAALVIGRRVEYDTLRMRLKLYVPGIPVVGYTPSVGVESYTGSDPWVLTVGFNDPLDAVSWGRTGEVPSDHFAVDDACYLVRWDVANNEKIAVTVSAVNDAASTITVTGAWTPGTDEWTLEYADATAALTTAQKNYAYFADSTRLISFVSGDVAAKVYGA